jgi:hypothetical protein
MQAMPRCRSEVNVGLVETMQHVGRRWQLAVEHQGDVKSSLGNLVPSFIPIWI